MPNWKKIALSGSNPEFNNVYVDNSVSAGSLTGSIDFSYLTNTPTLISNSAQISSDISGSFTSTSSSIASDIASLVSFSSSLETTTYDYTGSFTGDGSALTGISIATVATAVDTFTSSTTKTVNHNFNTKNVVVTVYNDSDQQIIPSTVTTTDSNNVTVTFDNATSGRVVVAKGGHIVSGSANDSNALGGKDAASYATTGSNQFNGNQYITGSIIPGANETYDLGSNTNRWRDLYLSGSTIVLGDTKITTDASGNVEFKDNATNARRVIKVDEIEIGSGATARKIKVDNGRVAFTDTSDSIQSQKVGHVLPSATNTYDLGSPSEQFRHIYMSSASLYVDGTKVLSSDANTLTFTTDVGQSIKILETGADDITLQTDTGNIELKGTVEILSGKKITDSAGTVIQFGDSLGITGSIALSGTVDGIDLQAMSSSLASRISGNDSDINTLSSNKATITQLNASSSALISAYGSADTALSSSLASAIATNTAKVGYTDALVKSKLNSETVVSGSASQVRSFLNVEDGADVTDAANVKSSLPTGVISGSASAARSQLGLGSAATQASSAFAAASHTHTASQITDFDTEVANNTAVAANTAKTGYTDTLVKSKLNTEAVLSGSITSAKITDVDAFSQSGTYANLRAQATTKADVGLGNVTNESKATMFTNAALTGIPTAPTQTGTDDSTKIATTAFVQGRIDAIIGTAGSTLDTLGELSASLASDQSGLASLTTTVGGKLAKAENLSDLANISTARTNLGLGTAATTNSTAYATAAQGTKADTAHGWGNHASAGYLTSQTSHADVVVDGDFTSNGLMKRTGAGTYGIITDNSSNWNTAYGWGNHASAGYITGYTETDTLATVVGRGSTATSITLSGTMRVDGDIRGGGQQLVLNAGESYSVATGQTSEYIYLNAEQGLEINSETGNWSGGWAARKTAYLKGDQLTLDGETLTKTNIQNFKTAYGWGNHASAGYLTSYTDTNYYLDGITKSGNTLTFSVNGATNQTYTFGANAFTSTTIPTNNNQLTNGAGYTTYTANQAVNTSSRPTFTSIDLAGATNPEITFNGSSDGGVDMAIKATPEGLDFYEPEDSNKVHFQILDDSGVNAAFGLQIGGTSVITSGRVLQNVTNSNWDTAYSWGNHASAGYITGYTETDTFATVTSRGATSNSSITINGLMIGGLGSQTTGGTTDWNNSTNARSGQGHSLLLGTHTNGPGTSNYYHPISFEYSSKDGSGNLTQFAIPYTGYNMYFRSRYSGTWAGWATMWNSGNDGAGSGLDADLWDGNQFASYLNQAVKTTSSPTFAGLTINGSITATGDIIAYSSSDRELKDNLKPIDNSLEKLKKISGYEFDWNEEKQDTYKGHDIGVVAQEVEEVLPEIVVTRDNGYKAVKYEKLTALLIQAVKEQQEQIEKLNKEIQALKSS